MAKQLQILIIVQIYFISGFSFKLCSFDVVLEQYLTNDGFHRNLTYEVTFANYDGPHRYDGCVVGVDQTLPPGVFANPDELEDLRRLDELGAVLKNRVNTELPAEEAQPSNVYVVRKLRDSVAMLWLPVHARYHAARTNGGYARNEIAAPHLYIRCLDARLRDCDSLNTSTYFCNGKCPWKPVPYTMLTSPVRWDVPVGNTSEYPLVWSVTLAAMAAGSLYILKTLHDYKLAHKKLQ